MTLVNTRVWVRVLVNVGVCECGLRAFDEENEAEENEAKYRYRYAKIRAIID